MLIDTRTSLPAPLRAAALGAYHGYCTYCEQGRAEALDHVVPISDGGRDDIHNLVPACKSCNSSKKDRTLRQWYHAVQNRWLSDRFDPFEDRLPDYIVGRTFKWVQEHVAEIQEEVVQAVAPHQSDTAVRLLSDINRLMTRLGDLDARQAELLLGELRRQLDLRPHLVTCSPQERYQLRWKTYWLQDKLRSALRKAA